MCTCAVCFTITKSQCTHQFAINSFIWIYVVDAFVLQYILIKGTNSLSLTKRSPVYLTLQKSNLRDRCWCEKKVVYSDANHLEDVGLMSQSPYPHLSTGRGFHKEGRETELRYQGEGVEKFSTCRRAQSIQIRTVIILCASSWFSHPGSMSSWIHCWRSANLLELRCLRVRVCIFWS